MYLWYNICRYLELLLVFSHWLFTTWLQGGASARLSEVKNESRRDFTPTPHSPTKAGRTPSRLDMNRQECRTKRIDSVCAVIWIPLCARDGSVIKWGRGEGETLSIHVESTWCAPGLKALLDGRVRLDESQVRLAESKCWWKKLQLHVGGSVSLTLSQEGCHSVALLAHVSIGEKIKCYLALIFAHGDTIYLYSCYCW